MCDIKRKQLCIGSLHFKGYLNNVPNPLENYNNNINIKLGNRVLSSDIMTTARVTNSNIIVF